jgi:putative ABC transport system permease protein
VVVDLGSAPVIYYSVSYSGAHNELLSTAEDLFRSIYPRDPFDYFFLDTYYNRPYEDEHRMSHVSTLFSSIAIIIACLGLFGLASFGIVQRTKEIGIRKVLGARILALIHLLFKEYAILIAVASAIAIPLVYIIMNDWLAGFTASVGIGLPLLLSTCMLVCYWLF